MHPAKYNVFEWSCICRWDEKFFLRRDYQNVRLTFAVCDRWHREQVTQSVLRMRNNRFQHTNNNQRSIWTHAKYELFPTTLMRKLEISPVNATDLTLEVRHMEEEGPSSTTTNTMTCSFRIYGYPRVIRLVYVRRKGKWAWKACTYFPLHA